MSGNNGFSTHYTETHPDVIDFLKEIFRDEPERVDIACSGDVEISGYRVEIKSCKEWQKSKCSNGSRRRGRFLFCGHERADYILFVLVREFGKMEFALEDASRLPLGTYFKINWRRYFPCSSTSKK